MTHQCTGLGRSGQPCNRAARLEHPGGWFCGIPSHARTVTVDEITIRFSRADFDRLPGIYAAAADADPVESDPIWQALNRILEQVVSEDEAQAA